MKNKNLKNVSYNKSKDHFKLKKTEDAFDGKSFEYKSNGSKKLSAEQYLKKIKPYLRHSIDDDHRTSSARKKFL